MTSPSKLPITAIIPCKNEEIHLAAALDTVAWAAEILVIDSFSTDNTLPIARRYTDRILQREYQNSADQKNWAIPQATHEWIFLLDADERVTPALAAEIHALFSPGNSPTADAYWVKRHNYFMGKRVRYSGWQGDAVIRLFRRDTCRYEDKAVHAEITTQGVVRRLNAPLLHYTFRHFDHYLEKMHRYARWSATDRDRRTKRITAWHWAGKPAWRFVQHYFFRLGFLDGRQGFVISVLMAWGVFLRYCYMSEQRSRKSQ